MRKIFTFFLALAASVGTMMASVNGGLTGAFSINASGDIVVFSQGNLQYKAAPTPTWQFAPNQWNSIGSANSSIAEDYEGWIDLFGWGTGNNPTLHTEEGADYVTFKDWGVNPISNGGNIANAWRTLTRDEWYYIFNSRSNASAKQGQAIVNNQYGLVLLPDEWELPTGLSFTAKPNNWTTNVYDAETWAKMEAAGAVFLPYAMERKGTTVAYNSYQWCAYWSATYYDSYHAWEIGFYESDISGWDSKQCFVGGPVRLVKDVKVPVVGDTLRYAYKGNNLYYKILYKNPTYKTVGLVNDGTPETYWTDANKPEGALVIPDSIEDWQGTKYAVTDIYQYAFRDCQKITSIDLSENKNITTVGRYSFGGCTAATSVTLSDNIKEIMDYAFRQMPLTSIDLKNVENLGQWVFMGGSNIETVHINKALKSIPDQTGLFEHAKTITCDAENTKYVVIDNALYDKELTKLISLPLGLTDVEIHIPATVSSMLYESMMGFEGTLFINSEITANWPSSSGSAFNSPKGDVFVGCHLLDFYTTGRYEGLSGDFGNIKSLNDTLLYSFSVSAGEHGSVQFISHGQCNVREISAFPDEHYEFVEWSNGSTEDHLDITVVSDTAITASFRAIQYDITFVDGLTDEVIEVKQGTFGSAVEAPTAPTHTGYLFTGWDNDDYLNIPGSVTVTALYEVDTTGFEQIEQSQMGNDKFIKDGQLFIRRNGELFNAQGARVK